MITKLQECAPQELQQQLTEGQPLQLVDVREYPEFAGGHITGSLLVPLGELGERAKLLKRDVPVILVCRSGKRSGIGQQRLRQIGFTKVSHLAGGLSAWETAGLPLQAEARAPWALERQVRLVAGLLVLAGLSLSYIWKPAIILSWFVPAGLVFAALTDTCMMGMLLAKLPWNRAG